MMWQVARDMRDRQEEKILKTRLAQLRERKRQLNVDIEAATAHEQQLQSTPAIILPSLVSYPLPPTPPPPPFLLLLFFLFLFLLLLLCNDSIAPTRSQACLTKETMIGG
eukprot:COSAG01_NODE_2145_length_8304_cov_162.380256_1_plen_109_part_00